jgi:hypothetical protein
MAAGGRGGFSADWQADNPIRSREVERSTINVTLWFGSGKRWGDFSR